MQTHFSITDSLKIGWSVMRANSALVFSVVLTVFGVSVVHDIVTKVLADTLSGGLASLVLTIAGVVINVGAITISLKLIRGKKAKYADLVPPLPIIWRYFVVGILLGGILLLPLLVGGIACAVILAEGIKAAVAASSPWIVLSYASTSALVEVSLIVSTVVVLMFYFGLRYSMAAFCIVDGNEVIQSMRESAKLTYGVKWHLFGFMLVAVGVYILGLLALLVGVLVAMPVIMLAYAHIYTELQKR